MSVNTSARKYRVWVCQPEGEIGGIGCFEVTDYCSGESGGFMLRLRRELGAKNETPFVFGGHLARFFSGNDAID